jgi:hypothetical protein
MVFNTNDVEFWCAYLHRDFDETTLWEEHKVWREPVKREKKYKKFSEEAGISSNEGLRCHLEFSFALPACPICCRTRAPRRCAPALDCHGVSFVSPRCSLRLLRRRAERCLHLSHRGSAGSRTPSLPERGRIPFVVSGKGEKMVLKPHKTFDVCGSMNGE